MVGSPASRFTNSFFLLPRYLLFSLLSAVLCHVPCQWQRVFDILGTEAPTWDRHGATVVVVSLNRNSVTQKINTQIVAPSNPSDLHSARPGGNSSVTNRAAKWSEAIYLIVRHREGRVSIKWMSISSRQRILLVDGNRGRARIIKRRS